MKPLPMITQGYLGLSPLSATKSRKPSETRPSASGAASHADAAGGNGLSETVELMQIAMRRAEWQPLLYCAQPRRSSLLGLRPAWLCRPLQVRVHRNEAIEHIASASIPFLNFAGYSPTFEFSGYSDALDSVSISAKADIELVWLDFARYTHVASTTALCDWLMDRMSILRRLSNVPLLVTNSDSQDDAAPELNEALEKLASAMPDVAVLDRSRIARSLAGRYYDDRGSRWTGARVSGTAAMIIARELGSRAIPGSLAPRLKAVAVDLDNTLYDGVLGEDGVHGVRLTPDHARLQQRLHELRGTGLYLAIASRNEPEDVERLFEERTDFPLRLADFSAVEVGWGDKSDSIMRIASLFRVAPSAVLFLDDNAGELADVASRCPGIHTAHASSAAMSSSLLEFYPCLSAHSISDTDRLRVLDLEAAAEREAAAATTRDEASYLRELQVRLTFTRHPREHASRLAELSQKTNQFNLSLKRSNEVALSRCFDSPRHHIISVSLRDRLADSGVIAFLLGREEEREIVVEELCISCRALGRRLEDPIIFGALRLMLGASSAAQVTFECRLGPRNGPARDWLARISGEPLGDRSHISVPNDVIAIRDQFPIEVEVRG